MASGDTLMIWTPQAGELPAVSPARMDARNRHPVVDFDAAVIQGVRFTGIMPATLSVGGAGLTVILHFAMSTSTGAATVWRTQFERTTVANLGTDGFVTGVDNTQADPATSGLVTTSTHAHTSTQIAAIVKGDLFRLQVTRQASNAADTAVGDAELRAVELREA